MTSRNPAVDLSCTAPVGTVGPDEKVERLPVLILMAGGGWRVVVGVEEGCVCVYVCVCVCVRACVRVRARVRACV